MNEELFVTDDPGLAGPGVGSGGGQLAGSAWDRIFKSANVIGELRKALAAGYETDPASMTDSGDALRIQSLEQTLKNLTFTEKSTVLANELLKNKNTADSTVLEYSGYDEISEAYPYQEGGLPPQESDGYFRNFELVKYIGAIGQVTNVILKTNTLMDAIASETKRKTLAIKRTLNRIGYFGDKVLIPTEFDGMLQAVLRNAPQNVFDMQGNRPTIENFNDAVAQLEDVRGYVSNLRLFTSPFAKNQYRNQLLKDKRYIVGGEHSAEVEGVKADKIVYDGGEFPMFKDKFLNPTNTHPRVARKSQTFIVSGDKPPATATKSGATEFAVSGAAPAGVTSVIPAGTYDFAVVAKNALAQKSVPAQTLGVVVAAGQVVTFTAVDGGSPAAQIATCFELFMRPAGKQNTDYQFIATISATDAENGWVYDGSDIPGTGYMFLVDWDMEEVLRYRQLMDMAKFELGPVADSRWWLQRLYGTLMVYNPALIYVFKNVGKNPV